MGDDLPDHTIGISVLAQALANLTAVVSATALDIRLLAEDDIAHEPIPYDLKTLSKDDWSITDGNYGFLTYSQAHWGSGKNMYPVLFSLYLNTQSAIFEKISSGISIFLWETSDDVPRWQKTYNVYSGNLPIIRHNGWRKVSIVENVRGMKLEHATNESLQILIYNYSGVTLAPDTCLTYFAI